jgi:hypothetical protein
LVHHDDGCFVIGPDRTVRIGRGHAYFTRKGALRGIREQITDRIDALNKARFQAGQAARYGAITIHASPWSMSLALCGRTPCGASVGKPLLDSGCSREAVADGPVRSEAAPPQTPSRK